MKRQKTSADRAQPDLQDADAHVELHLLRATFESSLDAILVVDHRTGLVVARNTPFLDLFKFPEQLRESADDRSLIYHAITQMKDPEAFVSLVEELYSNPHRTSFDMLTLVDGRVVERHSAPVMLDDEMVGRVWYFRDVTERLRQQVELEHASKMASLGEMAGGIAHEINNPLAIILGRVGHMLNRVERGDALDIARLTKDLKQIEQVAIRIEKIVKGLRSFARDGSHDPFLEVTLQDVVHESIDISAERLKNHGIALNVAMPDEPIMISARQVQIMQILLNLLNNARDAISELPDPSITVRVVTTADGSAQVRISDSGPGVPPEIESKIMQPFFTTKDPSKGTGLGLSIAHGIAKQHGGTLSLDTLESRSTFVLTLPLRAKGEIAA